METIDFNTVIAENISVVEGLIGIVTDTKNGLMPPSMYNVNKRKEVQLDSENVLKCVLLGSCKGQYKRGAIRIVGFYESNSIDCIINITDSSGTGVFSAKLNYLFKSDMVKLYRKDYSNAIYIYARSSGSSGNKCFIKVEHFGDIQSSDFNTAYEYDDSYNIIE